MISLESLIDLCHAMVMWWYQENKSFVFAPSYSYGCFLVWGLLGKIHFYSNQSIWPQHYKGQLDLVEEDPLYMLWQILCSGYTRVRVQAIKIKMRFQKPYIFQSFRPPALDPPKSMRLCLPYLKFLDLFLKCPYRTFWHLISNGRLFRQRFQKKWQNNEDDFNN
jgi:hypothetical protein